MCRRRVLLVQRHEPEKQPASSGLAASCDERGAPANQAIGISRAHIFSGSTPSLLSSLPGRKLERLWAALG